MKFSAERGYVWINSMVNQVVDLSIKVHDLLMVVSQNKLYMKQREKEDLCQTNRKESFV